jgi:hypothetical protein
MSLPPIPPALWAALPKNAAWWMAIAPPEPEPDLCTDCDGKGCHWCYWSGDRQPTPDDTEDCPGHGYITEDGDADMHYCPGACLT